MPRGVRVNSILVAGCIPRQLEIYGRWNSTEMGLARLKVAERTDWARDSGEVDEGGWWLA